MALRRPGSPWRVLVHTYNPGWKKRGEFAYTKSHHFSNDPEGAKRHEELHAALGGRDVWEETCLPGTEFDEVVVGRWLHVEAQNESEFWMNIAGITINVTADRDGRPRKVDVYGPGDYDNRNPNVHYSLTWSEEEMHDEKPALRKPTRWQIMWVRHKENQAKRLISRHARKRLRKQAKEEGDGNS